MTEQDRRKEQLWEFDEFFKRHTSFIWVLAIGAVFSVVGLLCVVRAIFQSLAR